MTDQLHLKQTMLSLAYTADVSADLTGNVHTIATKTKDRIECMLSTVSVLSGEWQVVWGPMVYRFPHAKDLDNTMFVAQKISDLSTYAVCIAGTNPDSLSDWFQEDLTVLRQYQWPYGAYPRHSSPKISHATRTGLHILQNMQPYTGFPGEHKPLAHFLHDEVQQSKNDVTIYVTGHSLGGALAPTTALWLTDTQGLPQPEDEYPWDPQRKATVKTYAFAGATPGNGDFASWINSQLSGDKMVVVNNTLDVVPHAWNVNTLCEIPSLYEPKYKLPLALSIPLNLLADVLSLGNYDYTDIGSGDQVQPINGSICDEPESTPKWERFLKQALHQHVNGYPDNLDLPHLVSILVECIKTGG